MISRDLLKRTPVRLAGAFTLLFALTVVALVAVLYLTLGAELESHILMFYTGVARNASDIAAAQVRAIPSHQADLHEIVGHPDPLIVGPPPTLTVSGERARQLVM